MTSMDGQRLRRWRSLVVLPSFGMRSLCVLEAREAGIPSSDVVSAALLRGNSLLEHSNTWVLYSRGRQSPCDLTLPLAFS